MTIKLDDVHTLRIEKSEMFEGLYEVEFLENMGGHDVPLGEKELCDKDFIEWKWDVKVA